MIRITVLMGLVLLTIGTDCFAQQPRGWVSGKRTSLPRATGEVKGSLARSLHKSKLDREEKDREADEATNGIRAQLFRYQQRGGRRIPAGALLKAKELMDQVPPLPYGNENPFQDDAGIWAWNWLGPGNIGGRILSILFTDNNTIYVGSAGGGIWRSSDRGANWASVQDFMASLRVTSIQKDASNSNQLYASTGEINYFNGFYGASSSGAGLFRSTDGGNSWQSVAFNNFPFTRVWAHPFVGNVVFCACAGFPGADGIWRSTDGGLNWDRVLTVNNPCDIKVDKNAWNNVVACTIDGKVFFSNSGGDPGTWSNQATGAGGKLPNDSGRVEVAFGDHESIYVSMNKNGGEVWRSMDQSASWQFRNSGLGYLGTQGNYANTIWVAPNDQELVVVGGLDLYRSYNGGSNFLKISDWQFYHTGLSAHADQHFIASPPNYGQGTIPNHELYVANDGGLQRSAEIYSQTPATPWINLANNLGITQFYAGSASPNGGIILGGAQDNDTLRWNSGTTGQWAQVKTGDGGFCAVDYGNTNVMYCEYVNLHIYKSTNGGLTYFDAITGLTDADNGNAAGFIAPFVMDPNSSAILVAGGTTIWRTTNSAGNWSSIRTPVSGFGNPTCSAIAIAKGNSSVIWVGYANGLVSKSTNTGGSWTNVSVGSGIPGSFVTSIAINPQNSNEVFVSVGGFQTNTLWFTADGGSTWTQRRGTSPTWIPPIQINSVAIHPNNPNWIYVGTDLGILASEDKGITWNRTPLFGGNSNHEGPTNAEVDQLFWDGGETLYAATHGRGMWRVWVPTTIYVDKNWNGSQVGTQSEPFNRVDSAVGNSGPATTYSIKSNTYIEGHKVYNKRGKFISTNGNTVIK